ncbi:MAG: acetate--CoA ligase family protein [Janthinobacterium lividum]
MNQAPDLSRLFNPKAVALVGASDRSGWSKVAFNNLKILNYAGNVHLVSRSGGVAHGQQTFKSAREIGEQVDVALLLVPGANVCDALRDLGAAHVPFAVVLAGGFAELGEAGKQAQDEMLAVAREQGISLIGPNCLGFINFTNGAACWTGSMRMPPLHGNISLVSQSGAVATFIKHFAHQQGIGLHCVVSTGNEPSIDLATVLDYLADDPQTRVITLFAETIRDPQRFSQAARRAFSKGKPVLVVKVGRSEITAQAAQSHTGSMVGNDEVFDGICRQLGLIRLRSIEEMVFTADILAKLGPLQGDGVALLGNSGGMGELCADYAHLENIRLPAFAPETIAVLRDVLPPIATPANPLDLTGGSVANPDLFENSLHAVASDPSVALIICVADVPTGNNNDWAPHYLGIIEAINRFTAASKFPLVLTSNATKVVSDKARELLEGSNTHYVAAGTDMMMRAVAHVLNWSAKYRRAVQAGVALNAAGEHGGQGKAAAPSTLPRTERETTQYLASFGVPCVPSALARSEQEAVTAAASIDGPVVLKIVSPDIAHKTEVGGVRLNIAGAAAVAEAYRGISASVAQALPRAQIDGVLVAPMRRDGIELFVGVRLDPQWGHVIAVGLGGVWIEALHDASLRVLPVTANDVIEMLGELRGAKLLAGFRSAPAVDLHAVAQVVARIGDAALGLGGTLDTLEVNPLLAVGARVEVLDALATFATN